MSPDEAQAPTQARAATNDGLAEARLRFDALRDGGASSWDQPGLDLAGQLLDTAGRCEDRLRQDLVSRALDHLAQLEATCEAARERAERARTRLEAQGHANERLQAAVERGGLGPLLRAVRRTPRNRPRLLDELRDDLGRQLDAQARERGISSPGTVEAPRLPSTAPLALATSLYRDAAAGAQARLTVAKTTAAVPRDAGRYHPLQLAARTLQTTSSSPAYLKALLLRLETLAVLWQHGLEADE